MIPLHSKFNFSMTSASHSHNAMSKYYKNIAELNRSVYNVESFP